MNILAANLKHLYQRHGAWLWYVILLALTPVVLLPLRFPMIKRYLGYLLISLLAGNLAGGMQKDVMIRPLSFCLPGHHRIPRLVVFWVGGVLSLILGCVFFGYPGLAFPYVLLVVLAGGLTGMIAFLYGAYTGLLEGDLLPAILWFVVFGLGLLKFDKVLQTMIVSQPILVILAGGLVCFWVWRMLGRNFPARRYCGKLVMGTFEDWDRQKAEKFRQVLVDRNPSAARTKLFERLHEFFLGRMKRYDFLSCGRYVWGYLYMVFGQCFGNWRMRDVLAFVAVMALFLLPFGFMGEDEERMINILFAVPAFCVLGLDLLPYRTMLLPAGRAERYYSSLILAAVVTLTGALLTLGLAGLTTLMERALPEFQLGRQVFSYHGLDIDRFNIFLLCMPIALIATIFPQSRWSRFILVFVLLGVWLAYEMKHKQILTETFGSAVIAGLIVLCWAGFLIVLRYACMKRSLVR
ncbi:MAG: hypothetical protein KAR47_06985 [Planctomycetes bacterium]|nr:hypothetical protein [Planctomycetota bacterium]